MSVKTRDDWVALMSVYGPCRVCGEPRRSHRSHETDVRGHTHYWARLVCTSDPKHSQEGV